MPLQIAGSFSGTGVRQDLGAADNLFVGAGVSAVSTDSEAIIGIGSFHKVQIFGSVFGNGTAIDIDSNGNDNGFNQIIVGQGGQIFSELGAAILLTGQGNQILNYGEISAFSGPAIYLTYRGDETNPVKITNYGSISSSLEGIYLNTGASFIRNYGDITSLEGAGISGGDLSDTVQNFGKIDGSIYLHTGDNKLVNRGLIVGDIVSTTGNDTVDNRFGTVTDTISLGAGDDVFKPGATEETANGEAGSDVLDFSRSSGVEIALDGSIIATGWAFGDTYTGFENVVGSFIGADVLIGNSSANTLIGYGGNDTLSGMAGDDILNGSLGNDKLDGGANNDYLSGDDGNDVLIGGAGNDSLRGGSGADTLTGGAGKDELIGGLGADKFIFAKADFGGTTAATAETITDFTQTEADRIDLSAVDASSKVAGDQAFTFIGSAAFHNVAGELRYAQINGSTYVQGDTNGDGVADFWIGLNGLNTLKAADFVL